MHPTLLVKYAYQNVCHFAQFQLESLENVSYAFIA